MDLVVTVCQRTSSVDEIQRVQDLREDVLRRVFRHRRQVEQLASLVPRGDLVKGGVVRHRFFKLLHVAVVGLLALKKLQRRHFLHWVLHRRGPEP